MAGGRRWRLPAQAAGRGVAGAVSIGRLPVCLPFCCQKWQHGHWVRELRMRRSLQEKRPLFMVQPHIVWRSLPFAGFAPLNLQTSSSLMVQPQCCCGTENHCTCYEGGAASSCSGAASTLSFSHFSITVLLARRR